MDSAYIEILDTNKELRKELASEIATNDISNKKLNSLNRELDACYKIISQQDSTIIAHENEIESLKSEIILLKQCLQKGLQDIEQKEKQLLSREDQLQELENRVDCLKKRIKELVDKKITINITDMAHPIRRIFDNRLIIANNIATIRRQLDNSGFQIPQDITGYFNNIADSLNEINQTTAIIQNFYQNQVTQLDQQTRRAIVAEQNLANIIAERDNFQSTLHDYQDMVAELTKDLTKANNDILHRDRLLEEGLGDEREARRQWWQIAQNRQINAQNIQINAQRIVARKQNRINELTQEKICLQLINRRRKAETDLVEFNRAWIFNRYRKWKTRELNSRQIILNLQINPPNMANMIQVNKLLTPAFATLPFYDGQEEPDSYYAKMRNINELVRPLAVANFNAQARSNKMREKMTGRFHPVPVNNPYNANNPINNEPEFLNWLQGKYRELMVGSNRDAFRSLMTEKFSTMDTADTYEKRIKPYVQGIPYADALPYLYEHMSQYMEMRLRQTALANLDAFFTNLRTIWLETRGRNIEQATVPSPS